MGDPVKKRKKYMTPTHPWQKDRIDEEKEIKRKYGLKNKKEIWKAQSFLRNMRGQARNLLAATSEQAEKETNDFLNRLKNLSILKDDADLDGVLALGIQDVLDRRLQSLVVRKGMAKTADQARQMITHGHVMVNGKRVSAPSYLVKKEEEETIAFFNGSPFLNKSSEPAHAPAQKPPKKMKVEKPKEEEDEEDGE
ncbi:MAG: 30S ribosomal protein S4 [Candidatus Methanofastidiosa archaeon]|nr:30S ribosomal protein S4 [Candidatus Methanofastidiosa archaeon]